MNKNTIISIVIPVKGRINFVIEAINSILNQNLTHQYILEIIIVEDYESPKTFAGRIKQLYPQIRYIKNKDKEGPGGCRNTGLEYAKGKYIIFLDSDDQFLKKSINIMLDILTKDKAVAVVCLSYSKFEKKYSVKERIKLLPLMWIRDFIFLTSYYFNSTNLFPSAFYLCQISHMMFKKRSIDNIRFNYDFRRGGEDWDFFSRVLERGSIKIILKCLLIFRYTPGSTTDSALNRKFKWSSYLKLAGRLGGKFQNSIFYRLFLVYIRIYGGKNSHA